MTDEIGEASRETDQLVEIDARVDALILEHEHEVFGREVASGTRSERRASQPTDRGVEPRDARVEARECVREGGPSGVVQVQSDVGSDRGQHSFHAARGCRAGGVGQGHAADTCAASPLDDAGDRAQRDVLERRPERARDHRVELDPFRRRDDVPECRDRLFCRAPHVLQAVAVRRGDRERQGLDAAGSGELDPASVRHECPPPHVCLCAELTEDLLCPGHRRHGLRRHERARLDVVETGLRECAGQVGTRGRWDRVLALEPVARRDVADLDRRHAAECTFTSPGRWVQLTHALARESMARAGGGRTTAQ